ncbi:MAG: peptidoglycan editing factor PgeF [Acidobacteriota bacterium]
MKTAVARCPSGPYLDLGPYFPRGVFAFLTLRGDHDVSPEGLSRFLKDRGHPGIRVHRADQVHSDRVVRADEAPCAADALVGDRPGEAVRVVTADCVPILLCTSDGTRVAAVHSGWKGTLSRIVERAAQALSPDPSDLTAYVGPAVGPCCYGVDEARHRAFREAFPGWVGEGRGALSLDLAGLNARMLTSLGLRAENLHVESRCTACEALLCCSYRRDGERAGRMAAVIGRSG